MEKKIQETEWKFKAHIGFNGGKRGLRMETKEYNSKTLYRETGIGNDIYYVQDDARTFPNEKSLKDAIDKTLPSPQ